MKKFTLFICSVLLIMSVSLSSVFAVTYTPMDIAVPYWYQIFYNSVNDKSNLNIVPYIARSNWNLSGTSFDNVYKGNRYAVLIAGGYTLNYEFPVENAEKYYISFYAPLTDRVLFDITITSVYHNGTVSHKDYTYHVDGGNTSTNMRDQYGGVTNSSGQSQFVFNYSNRGSENIDFVRFSIKANVSGNVYLYLNFIGPESFMDISDQILTNVQGYGGNDGTTVWTRSDIQNFNDKLIDINNNLYAISSNTDYITYQLALESRYNDISDSKTHDLAFSLLYYFGYKRAYSEVENYAYSKLIQKENYSLPVNYDSSKAVYIPSDSYLILYFSNINNSSGGNIDIILFDEAGNSNIIHPLNGIPVFGSSESVGWQTYEIPKGKYTIGFNKGINNVYPMYFGNRKYVPPDIANMACVPSFLSYIIGDASGMAIDLVNGTPDAEKVYNDTNDLNNKLNQKIGEYDLIEEDISSQFESSINDIELKKPDGIADFATTANFLAIQMGRVYNIHPSIKFMIDLSLILGIVLIILGVIRRHD